MRKRVVTLLMAFFALMVVSETTASAATYYGKFSALNDRAVIAYIDDVVTRDRDGWCADNGSGRSWDCFVNRGPGGTSPQVVSARQGEVRMLSGRRHRAQLSQPFAGWKPYCDPSFIWQNNGTAVKVYTCAYWLPA